MTDGNKGTDCAWGMGMAEIPDEPQGEGIGLLPGAELQATRESVYVDYRPMSLSFWLDGAVSAVGRTE